MSNMPGDDDGQFLPVRLGRRLPATQQTPQGLTGTISENYDIAFVVHYLRVLWKGKWILLLCTVLGVLGGFAKSLWTTPLYFARTSLQIEQLQEPFIANASGGLDMGTKVQILQSQKL